MKFSEVIGQKEVWARLMQMAEEERIPHAIMFCGPKGCGKMAVALAFVPDVLSLATCDFFALMSYHHI